MISPQQTSSSMVKIWKYILCELGARQGFPLLTNLFSIVSPSHSNQMRKWHMAPNWKGQSKKVSLQMAWYCMCMRAKSLQSCPTLCNPLDYSPPGSPVQGIVQARILEWVAMPSSKGSSWSRDWTCVSYISCVGRQILCHECHLGRPYIWITVLNSTHLTVKSALLLWVLIMG